MNMSEPITAEWERSWQPEIRVEFHLENWSVWQRAKRIPDEFHVTGGDNLQGYKHYDTEGGYLAADAITAEAMDALITGDLKRLEREAIYAAYLDCVWGSKLSFGACLVVAKQHLRTLMSNHGIV